ncbi:helix-turn-helix domain-containing protein [Streptomyces lucensis]|uniref:helix-turn-helix domain-containing protein n=1 Tax=Streptomyces lucensis TaxID=67319 RepID=UPI001E304FCC|nr:helix-turn-helix transcriptional regulator [Streptomyces lucensis]
MSTQDDVEEFAALLRRLKDRTDRSYGSLARRLNMNTSTLHRYCAGEAVPQDFAPVERLAAFCEATPAERLELHRLWLAALAARQRTRTAGPAEAAVAAEAAEAEADGSLTEKSGPAGSPGDGTPGDAAPHGTAAHGTAPNDAAPHDPAPDDRGPHDPAPEDEREPIRLAPSPAPRPWYRRKRVLAPTAVTCALLAALGSTSALSDDHPSEPDASRTAGPRTTALGSPGRSAQPSATASPSPSRSSKTPGPRRKTSTPSPTGAGSAPSAKPATGLPLIWSADSQVWDQGCGHDYVIDKSPAQVPPPPVQQDAAAWAATQGAAHGRQTMVQISVQGRSSTAVVLEALRVRVVSRGNPAAGRAYAMDQGCGGDMTPGRFTVNLDVDRPTARPKDGADVEHTIPAAHFPYRVSAEDPEVLLVDATTQAYDARWYLELDWSSQGRTGTIRIDDHGRPFHTTSIKGMPRYWYGTNSAGVRAWVPYDG